MCTRAPDLRMHETGAVVLSRIPESIAAICSVQLQQLPHIMASCDAVVRDSSGSPQFLVEAKHRFPYRPVSKSSEKFRFIGSYAKPIEHISVEQYVQRRCR